VGSNPINATIKIRSDILVKDLGLLNEFILIMVMMRHLSSKDIFLKQMVDWISHLGLNSDRQYSFMIICEIIRAFSSVG